MKKILFIIIALVIISSISKVSQGQWETFKVDPIYQFGEVTSVSFINANTGCVGTLGRGIYRTTNAGVNWFRVFNDIYIRSLKILPSGVGYATGSSGIGIVLKTTNAGVNWNWIISSHDIWPQKITLVNENDIIIACPFSTTYTSFSIRTADGGISWSHIFTTNELDLVSTIVGSNLYSSTKNHFWSFANGNWIMNGNGEISSFSHLARVNFGNDEFVYTGGQKLFGGINRPVISSTSNQGLDWTVTYLDTTTNSPGAINEIYFSYTDRYAIGAVGSTGKIYKLINQNWQQVYEIDSVSLRDICVTSHYVYFVGDNSTLIRYDPSGVGVINNSNPINNFSLNQNYPNPFNPVTKISYSLPKNTDVTLRVYGITGQEISTLVDKKQVAENYEVSFDGSKLSSGIYFYRLTAGEFIETKKMILIK